MRAYSLDLRQKVVAAVERGDSTIEEVASAFGVGQTFVKKMLRQHREIGDLRPRRNAKMAYREQLYSSGVEESGSSPCSAAAAGGERCRFRSSGLCLAVRLYVSTCPRYTTPPRRLLEARPPIPRSLGNQQAPDGEVVRT